MKEKIVIGHINPDTDSVVSAVMFSRYLNREGKDFYPAIAGDVNRETEFVFSYFKEDLPMKVTKKESEDKDFFLVDHNDLAQSVASIKNIFGVLDHHLLSGMKTDETVFFRVEPVGSTATLIYKMMKERSMEVDEKEAGLLLASIISDTLNLNSPTTTSEDVDLYYELAEISKIEANNLAEKMFEAKSDFSGIDIKEIICGDMKEYDFGGKRIGLGISETTSLSYFNENKELIGKTLKEIKDAENFDAFFFGAVDIIKGETWFFPAEEEEKKVVNEVFEGEEKSGYLLLKDVSSRKKQMAPPLSEYYNKKS